MMTVRSCSWVLLIACGVGNLFASSAVGAEDQTVSGYVFHDQNANGMREPDEAGLAKVRVSNGRDVVETDQAGRYELPVSTDTVVFVIKPRGWMVPTSSTHLPRFYYVHKPNGSPANLEYPGVSPTGPLPSSVDFPLQKQEEPKRFKVVAFGDPQPNNLGDIYHLAHDVVPELVGTDAAFGLCLGDLMADSLDLFPAYNDVMGQIGIPFYNTIGNHDINFDVSSDALSDETWERVYGPATYSFDWGPVHFIVADNVYYDGDKRYHGEFTEQVLEFIRNDLRYVPRDQLVVVTMHIPLTSTNYAALLELLKGRPSLSLAGHAHQIRHRFVAIPGADGERSKHHHVVNGAVCGIHWLGDPDEYGIPHAMAHCGAPNGYTFINFDGNEYSMKFKAPRRPDDDQMHIFLPSEMVESKLGETEVLVNVYFGSEKNKTEMRVDDGPWVTMKREIRQDPYLLKVVPPGHPVSQATHIWAGKLPESLKPGGHTLHVRTQDMFGQTFSAARVFRVLSEDN